MSKHPHIVWFRQDLRLADNPALRRAAQADAPLVALYIHEEVGDDHWLPRAAGRYWLHHALEILDNQLQKLGNRLILKRGDPLKVLPQLVKELSAETLLWNRRYEPAGAARDRAVEGKLAEMDVQVEKFNGRLLREPWEVKREGDQPVRVFTPFWKKCIRDWEPDQPLPAPKQLPHPPKVTGLALKDLKLLPVDEARWDSKLDRHWKIGEQAGQQRLRDFVSKKGVDEYGGARNALPTNGTSTLSPYLAWGHISPRQIWHAVKEKIGSSTANAALKTSSHPFTRQLFWREFSYSMLVHFPHTPDEPLREEFAHFPWRDDRELFRRWSRGRTGFPIVDAGMNQLWEEGWLHNRSRMIVASFLVKDLMIHWQDGARWFWDTLVDADLADNTMGWQWVAGCGADSAPYFRIFNPLSQAQRFDPEGEYVRRYVPELAKLPKQFIHTPWEASREELDKAGVELDGNYPRPMVDHAKTRQQALDNYAAMRGK